MIYIMFVHLMTIFWNAKGGRTGPFTWQDMVLFWKLYEDDVKRKIQQKRSAVVLEMKMALQNGNLFL